MGCNSNAITALTKGEKGDKGDSYNPLYTVYTALLSQSSTDAPVATVLENTLGGTVVWTRTSAGLYKGTLAGVFTLDKTVAFQTPNSGALILIDANVDVDYFELYSAAVADGVDADDLLINATVEIRVYL